jgi:hypothetical protein
MKTHRPLRLLLTSAILVALAAGPLVAVETGVSPKLGLSTYADREGRVTLVVDSYAASLREGEAYVPIRMALGIVGKGKPVRFDAESFTLTDRNGNEVPLASYQDVQRNYDKRLADESVLRTRPMMLDSRFDALDRIDSRFFPSPAGRGTRVTRVELAPGTWLQDVLYFPRPPAGTNGVMTFTIKGHGMDYPIKVKFRIHEPGEGEQLQG